MTEHPRASAVALVVGNVLRQALRDAGSTGIVVLDDGSPEARLALEWCRTALGDAAVLAAQTPAAESLRSLLDAAGVEQTAASRELAGANAPAAEAQRFVARLLARSRGALLAHPANKTALLLAASLPPEPLLPLGDLYATQVAALTGGWTAPPEVLELAEVAGGIERVDAALIAYVDERRDADEAFAQLPPQAGDRVREALEAGRFARRRVGLVPKLGPRTLGIDLFA